MTKITSSFLTLVLIIVFSSIAYIWKSEAEQKVLTQQIASQQSEIKELQNKIKSQTKSVEDIPAGEVQGVSTITGGISGSVSFLNQETPEDSVVCVLEVFTQQEYCTNLENINSLNEYEYSFDIPLGTYEAFISQPNNQDKVYYSEIQTCDESGDCYSDPQQKRLIKVLQDETQTDINFSIK